MTLSLTLACLWIVAASIVAFLPMRFQYVLGLLLLLLAVPLLVFLAMQHGVWLVAALSAAIISMFRRPLIYFYRRARGLPATRPRDEEAAK